MAAHMAEISSSAWKVTMPSCFRLARECKTGEDGVIGYDAKTTRASLAALAPAIRPQTKESVPVTVR